MGNIPSGMNMSLFCKCIQEPKILQKELDVRLIEKAKTISHKLIEIIRIQSHLRKFIARKKYLKKLLERTTVKSFEEGFELNLSKTDNSLKYTNVGLSFIQMKNCVKKLTKKKKNVITYEYIDENFFPEFQQIIIKLEQAHGNNFIEKFNSYYNKINKLYDVSNKNEITPNKSSVISSLRKVLVKYSDNSYFKGFFDIENKREGYGVFIFQDQSKYEGNLKSNNMEGYGKLINIEGDFYEGVFKNNKFHGDGILIKSNGDKYKGEFLDGYKHGTGEENYNNGVYTYKGIFKNNLKNGEGKLNKSDKFVYQGCFFMDMMDGKGIAKWTDGRVYHGEWKNDKMHGRGIFSWQDGDKYYGQYENDKKAGYGVFIWSDKKKYEGQWVNGKQHGMGVFTSEESVIYGVWENGNLVEKQKNKRNITYDILLLEIKYTYEDIIDNFGGIFKNGNA